MEIEQFFVACRDCGQIVKVVERFSHMQRQVIWRAPLVCTQCSKAGIQFCCHLHDEVWPVELASHIPPRKEKSYELYTVAP